jgi:anti-sigma factor RsiW
MSDEHAIRDLLPGYALGCLDPEDEGAVRMHLPRCAACRAELESYAIVVDLLAGGVPAAEPPADLEAKILRGLKTTRPSQSRTWRPALSAMAAVFVAALVTGNVLQWSGVIRHPSPAGATPLLTASLVGRGDARRRPGQGRPRRSARRY